MTRVIHFVKIKTIRIIGTLVAAVRTTVDLGTKPDAGSAAGTLLRVGACPVQDRVR